MLRFRVRFQRQPLADRLVQAWHRDGEKTTVLRTRSTANGEVEFTLPAAGPWMISVVQMIAAQDKGAADWDSYWGNLTFALPP